MRVKLWGVRGSIPTPLSTEQFTEKLTQALTGAAGVDLSNPAEVQAYIAGLPLSVRGVVGGNTTCVEIDTGAELIIIDAGSGIRALGLSLMAREFGKGQGTAHIFLTHAHWDHLQGYPFFAPAYVPGNKLIFYAVNYNPQRYLEHQQVAPMYFPIPPNAMPAEKDFVQLREGEVVQIGRTRVSSLALYHPGTAYAYRFDDDESAFVFASDGEYKSLSEAHLKKYVEFFQGADALVFDSQYSLRDVFLSKADWGHSSAIIGIDIAERAKVKRLITFHHDPTHSDEQIYAIANAARDYAAVNQPDFSPEVLVGTEGLELILGKPLGLDVTEDRAAPVWTLTLSGQLSAISSGEAQKRLRTLLAESPDGRVMLDLTTLSSADALGLRGLVDVARHHEGAQLAVLAPTMHVRRALEQSGVGESFRIFRNKQHAITALTGPAHLRLASETIGGQFQIDELLFTDDTGVTYRGSDQKTHDAIIVRVVAGQLDDFARTEFAAQIQAWRNLLHPTILASKGIITNNDWTSLVCARPDGFSLREWRTQQKPMWLDVWHAAEQLCQAMKFIHERGLVHGDVRPENVTVSNQRVQLSRIPLFLHPTEYGPNAYHSPEQLRGRSAVNQRTDVYSLGVVLYELFIGSHPFVAESEDLRLTLQLYSQPQSPRLRWPDIPLALEQLLLKALALSPDDRFANGHEMLEAYSHIQPKPVPEN